MNGNIDEIISYLLERTREDKAVSLLDPLQADDFLCTRLPILNDQKDAAAILHMAEHFSQKSIELNGVERTESLAVLRDLGFIAASLIRHEAAIPDKLSKALLLYGSLSEEVPRDTVFSYGPRNPLGKRRRKFTTLAAEDVFISSFVAGMEQNLDCLVALMKALTLPVGSETFTELLLKASASFSAMVESMIVVKKEVTPETFTYELRPYFDPISINGRKYFAPGGAQMPVILIDMLLWGKDSKNHYYHEYFKENLSYSPNYYRAIPEQISELPSMAQKIAILMRQVPTEAEKKSLQALQELLTSLVRFRHVHIAVAKANFALRSASDVGSGGYRVDILERLLEETTNMRNSVKSATLQGFFSMKNDFSPYAVGTVFNEAKVLKPPQTPIKSVKIEYPTRLNAMAIDPSGITSNKNMVYTPGEVVLAVNLPRYVSVRLIDAPEEIRISGDNVRKSLVHHAVQLMRKALNVNHGLDVFVEAPHEIRHAGLGSSSGTIASVCAAINELYGCPIANDELIRYTAQNHGEEIDGQENMLMPVQCIGGAAAAGLYSGGILVITGESSVVASANSDLSVVVAIPNNYVPLDSKALMEKEIENLDKFLKTGEKYRHEIAYEMLHGVIPAMTRGDISVLGNLVFNYRFNMGSINNCSFVYPRMNDIAENVRALHEQKTAVILALSSVGPAFFAVTDDIEACRRAFEQCDMSCTVTQLYNSTYRVLERVT